MGTDFKLGIESEAKPIIQASIGIGNKTKPILAGWIGVDNKAKLFYSSNIGTPPYSKVFPDGNLGWYNGSINISKYEVYRRTVSSSTYTLDGTYTLASKTIFVKDRTYDYKHTFTSSNFNRQNCYMYKIVCYNSSGKEICVDGPHYVPWVGFEFDQTYLNYNGTIYYLSGATTSGTESVYGVQRYGYKYSGWYTGTGGTGIKYRDSMFVSVGNGSYNMETDKYYNSDATYKGNYYDIIKLYPAFSANYWLVDLNIGKGILVDSNNTEYTDQVLRVYVDKDQNTLGTCKIFNNNLSINSLAPNDYELSGYRYTFKKWANRNGTEYSSSSTISSDFLDGTNPLTAIYNSSLILTTPTINGMDLTDNTHNTSTTVSGHSASNVYIYFKSPTDGDISYIVTTKYQQDGTEYTGNMINTGIYNNYSYSLKMATINVTTNQVGIRAVDTSGNQQEVNITVQWYKILVSVNGGNESNPDITYRFQAYYPINSGENLGDLINFSPTRSGYTFKGWYMYKNGFTSKRVYTYTTMDELDSSSYYTTDTSYSYLRSISIYAKWEQTTYTVTIYRNGADSIGFYRGYVVDDSSSEYKTYEVPAGTALSVIMPSSASRSADSSYIYTYNSSGLSTSSTATSPNYSSSYSINSNLTLYVVWTKAQSYSIYIYKGDATSFSWNTSSYSAATTTSTYYLYYVPYGVYLSNLLPTSNPSRSGYDFSGWEDRYSSTTTVDGSTKVGSRGYTIMKIYPVFTQQVTKYTVYFNRNGADSITYYATSSDMYVGKYNSGSNEYVQYSVPDGTALSAISPYNITKSGYTWVSGIWGKSASATSSSSNNVNDSDAVHSYLDLYPVFEAEQVQHVDLTISISSISGAYVYYTYTGDITRIEAYKINSSNNMYEKTQTSVSTGYVKFGNTSNMENGVFLIGYNSNDEICVSRSGSSNFTSGTLVYSESSAYIPNASTSSSWTFSANTNYIKFGKNQTQKLLYRPDADSSYSLIPRPKT